MSQGLLPIFNSDSELLFLGSFPSIISRAHNYYFANPQNKFFKILGRYFNKPLLPTFSNNDKTEFLLAHHIALWDTIKATDISSSSDSDIKNNYEPNDLTIITNVAHLKLIILVGKKSLEVFLKYYKNINIPYLVLPSTSPANNGCFDIYEQYEAVLKIYF